jgi:hypothetical protein
MLTNKPTKKERKKERQTELTNILFLTAIQNAEELVCRQGQKTQKVLGHDIV